MCVPEETRTCPCCGVLLAPGLFAIDARVVQPVQAGWLAAGGGNNAVLLHAGGVVTLHGRAFIAVRASLPLNTTSPVAVHVWVEVDWVDAERYLVFRESGLYQGAGEAPTGFGATGSLACDMPGFPATMGSHCRIVCTDPIAGARMTDCADLRVQMLGRELQLDHQGLVNLYRRTHGGSGAVAQADGALRAATTQGLLGGTYFAKPIEPFGRFAGIEPPQLLVRPPLDTDGEVHFATVGIAEAMEEQKLELVAAARNGGPEFEQSFGEFVFWSRTKQNPPLQHGMIVPERHGAIPSAPQMVAWLITEQLETEEGPLCPPPVTVGKNDIHFLAAVPITAGELTFAQQSGTLALIAGLEASGIDLADLQRESWTERFSS